MTVQELILKEQVRLLAKMERHLENNAKYSTDAISTYWIRKEKEINETRRKIKSGEAYRNALRKLPNLGISKVTECHYGMYKWSYRNQYNQAKHMEIKALYFIADSKEYIYLYTKDRVIKTNSTQFKRSFKELWDTTQRN